MGALRLAIKGDSQGLLRLLRRSSSLRLAIMGRSGWDLVRAASAAVESRYYAQLAGELGSAEAARTHVEKRQRQVRLEADVHHARLATAPGADQVGGGGRGRRHGPHQHCGQGARHAAPLVGGFPWGGSVGSWRVLRPRPGPAPGGWRLDCFSRSFRRGGVGHALLCAGARRPRILGVEGWPAGLSRRLVRLLCRLDVQCHFAGRFQLGLSCLGPEGDVRRPRAERDAPALAAQHRQQDHGNDAPARSRAQGACCADAGPVRCPSGG